MAVAERQITVSGANQYVPLTRQERESYLLEFWFTSLQGQKAPYTNFEWYPLKKFYGRFAFASGLYVVEEKLCHFSNELLAAFRADALNLNENLQCAYVDIQALSVEAVAAQPASSITALAIEKSGGITAIASLVTALFSTLTNLDGGVSGRLALVDIITGMPGKVKGGVLDPPRKFIQPRAAVGHPIDGLFYSMSDFASGAVTIRSYYNAVACFIPGTDQRAATDERQPPPATAAGGESAGGPGSSPPATGTGSPPEQGAPAPGTPLLPSPLPPVDRPGEQPPGQTPGVQYIYEYGYTIGGRQQVTRSTAPGVISGWKTVNVGSVGGRRASFTYGGGSPGGPFPGVSVDWNVNGFPNQIPSGFFVRIIGRA